jgi:ketosteroid isomerase-like protein
MAQPNVELVQRLFDVFERDRLESAIQLLSEDFVAVVPPSMSAEPDTYAGHDGVRRYMGAFDGVVDDVRFRPLELHEEGDRVLTRLAVTGRGSASGLPVELEAVAIVSVEAGKVSAIEAHPDMETARRALAGR